jgi:P4 family phage/plasmid primase-like protien
MDGCPVTTIEPAALRAIDEFVSDACRRRPELHMEDLEDAVREGFAQTGNVEAAILGVALEYHLPTPARRAAARQLWVVNETGREKPDRAAFIENIMLEHRFLATRDNDDLFYYRDGCYLLKAKPRIREWVEDKFRARGETSSNGFTTEVICGVIRRSYAEREVFNPKGKLCLENGILDLATLTVAAHDSSIAFTYRLPVKYDPTAVCPTFDLFIAEVVPDDVEREKIHRLFGYCLEPGNPYQTAFLAVGGGNNGKSTALCLLRDLLGCESVSGETLQSLCEGRFGTYSLWGKLANICTDIPASPIHYTGVFKMLTGGEDSVRAERKFADAFFFTNPAKLVFSANELPPVENDRSYAFWRRWVTIDFPVELSGHEDRDLPSKLRAELPGILNWALNGLRSLRATGGFPTSPGGLKEDWRRRSEPLYWFISEHVDVDSSAETVKDDFYQAYAEFASDRNLPTQTPDRVGALLSKYIPTVRTVRHRAGRDFKRFWSGIRLRPDGDPPSTPSTPSTHGAAVSGVPGVLGEVTLNSGTPAPGPLTVPTNPVEQPDEHYSAQEGPEGEPVPDYSRVRRGVDHQ